MVRGRIVRVPNALTLRAPAEKHEDPRQMSLLDVRELAKHLADALSSPTSGKSFLTLCDEWHANALKRLVVPANERRHINHLRALWPLPQKDLTAKVARAELLALLRPAGRLGPVTVNKVRNTALRVIREAQVNGDWVGSNPFELVDRLPEPKPCHYAISLGEARAALRFLREDRRREAVFNLLMGPRPGEMKALLKTDVDLRKQEITFRRSNGRDQTKTGRARTMPIPRQLLPVLKEAIDASPCTLVFPNLGGGRQRADTKLSRTLRTALAKAGIVTHWAYTCRRTGCGFRETYTQREDRRCPSCRMRLWIHGVAPRVRWYDWRAASATLHLEAGCNPFVVRRCLGHAPRSTTEADYVFLSMKYMRRELNRLRLFR